VARGEAPDLWRIVAAHDNTKVSTIPFQQSIAPMQAGDWVEISTRDDFMIESTMPILVTQFLASKRSPNPNIDMCQYHESAPAGAGFYCAETLLAGKSVACRSHLDCPSLAEPNDAGVGDPSMILSVPMEQWRSEYVFLVPDNYRQSYINLTAPLGAQVVLDGEPVGKEHFKPFGNGLFAVARIPVTKGVHRASGSLALGVTVYGWAERVSYGYPAGQNLHASSLQ